MNSNIIDRSPMKTSAQESLWTQSTRRMNEARTAEEKASVVQNFAEQLRLEKLRAKRLKENMQELNNAISNPMSRMPVADVPQLSVTRAVPPGRPEPSMVTQVMTPQAARMNLLNPGSKIGDASISLVRNQHGDPSAATASWVNPHAGHFDLFKHGAGNVNALGNGKVHVRNAMATISISLVLAMKPAGLAGTHRLSNGDADIPQRRFSEGGAFHSNSPTPAVTSPSQSPASQFAPSSRPLNVNAAPFVIQPKPIQEGSFGGPSYQQPYNESPLFGQPPSNSALRRASMSPPAMTPAVAVAPKGPTMDWRQPLPVPTEGRPRSSSIGAQMKPVMGPYASLVTNATGEQPTPNDGRGGDVVYVQRSTWVSPPATVGQFSHLTRNSDFPKQQMQPEGISKPKPPMGSVKINLAAAGGSSLLQGEDWDKEYVQSGEKQDEAKPKRESELQKKTAAIVEACVKAASSIPKDWVSVLKEREDMANRRYSKVRLLEEIV